MTRARATTIRTTVGRAPTTPRGAPRSRTIELLAAALLLLLQQLGIDRQSATL